jgi:methyl-accepting chemotaxis protein
LFKNIRLRTRLLGAFLLVGLIPFACVGAVSLIKASRALSKQSYAQLEAVIGIKRAMLEGKIAAGQTDLTVLMQTVAALRQAAFEKLASGRETKKGRINDYFNAHFSNIKVLSVNQIAIEALTQFASVFRDEKGDTQSARYRYLEKIKFGATFTQFKEEYGYADLYLIDTEGNIVYSVSKKADLAQNILTGTLKDSPLAHCFRRGVEGISLEDIAPYAPAGNQSRMFLAAPVKKEDDLIGVIALQLSADPVLAIVERREGSEEAEQTYLVGKWDGKISSRPDMAAKGAANEISMPYVEKAISGEAGGSVFNDSLDHMCFVSYAPLGVRGLNWAIISKIDMEVAIAPVLKGEREDYFTKYVKRCNYRNLLMIHPDGKVFYTVAKKADHGADMITGEYRNSNLGRLVKKVLETKTAGAIDFEPYAPGNGEPAAFIAEPVVFDGKVDLIVALQLSLDTVNGVMRERSGMGR